MRNYRELVYTILDELKIFSDDSVWETDHVVSALNKYRSLLFTQKYKGKKVEIPNAYYQRLEVNFDTTYDSSGSMFKSFKQIPSILDITDLWKYTFISNDGIRTENLNFVSSQRFKNTGYNKWLRNQLYATVDLDNYMYVKSPTLADKALVGSTGSGTSYTESSLISENGLFQLISEVSGNAYLYYDTILDNPIDGYRFNDDNAIDVLDFNFHCEESLIQPIIDLCLKEFSASNQQRRDIQNNASDDFGVQPQQLQQIQ